jgi:hypothetical protein
MSHSRVMKVRWPYNIKFLGIGQQLTYWKLCRRYKGIGEVTRTPSGIIVTLL